MDNAFYIKNREKVIETMEDNSCLIMFSGSPPKASRDQYYEFQPDRNFYYLSGITRPNLILFICKYSGKEEVTLFIDNSAGLNDHPMTIEEAVDFSGIEQVVYSDTFENKLSRHISREACDTLYFDLNRINVKDAASKSEIFANEFIAKYPSTKICNIYKTICNFRVYKSQGEIDEIRKAVSTTADGINKMMKCIKPGINESDLEAEFMYCLYKNMEPIPAFSNIIASGKNAFIGHYSANNSVIEEDVLVQIDVGAQSKWYCADVSRALPSSGIFTERQKLFYNICNDALDKMIEYIKPGITSADSVEYGKTLLLESLKEIGTTMENTEKLSVYLGINHYVGLDVHDVGDRNLLLAPGMVVAVDSSVIVPAEGICFRIEDDMLITETGCEVLTESIPRNIEDIEAICSNK